MDYRREIDGLRALAVLPVILFHAGFETFSGGFVGVDIFFVISGYLITGIIYEQINAGKFSFYHFYDRRIRRIIPPLLAASFLTILIAATFSPADIKNVGQSLVSTFSFLSNYFFYLETDYFNPFNQNAPLLHTWSLSVEEQFYVFFPVLLFLFPTRRKKYIVLTVLAVLSFFAAVKSTQVDPNLSFYSIHTRGWELFVGALLALYQSDKGRHDPVGRILYAEGIVLVSVGLLFGSFFLFDEHTRHPSWPTIIPVFSTAAIIYYSQFTSLSKRLLGNRVLVGVGLLSYALYLFHNPIFSAIKYHSSPENSFLYKMLSLPVVALLAYISFRFIEKPTRNAGSAKAAVLYPVLAILVAAMLVLGLVTHLNDGYLNYFKRQLIEAGGVQLVDVEHEKSRIDVYRSKYSPSDAPFRCDEGSKCTNILIFGDSFAEDAFLALSSLEDAKLSVRKIDLDDECMGGVNFANPPLCQGRKVSFELLDSADVIVVTAKWQESTYQDGLEFSELVKRRTGKSVLLVGSVMFEDLSSFSFKTKRLGGDQRAISHLAYSTMRFDRLRISDKLKTLAFAGHEVMWLDKIDFFCRRAQEQCHLFDEAGNPLIWDNAHLTTRAYSKYGAFLRGAIDRGR